MVKYIFILLFPHLLVANSFQTNCLSCHTDKEELKLFIAKYTIQYSSQRKIKKAIFRFLNNPTSNKSIMPYSFIIKNGFKTKSSLDSVDLKQAIDEYYKQYNIKQFIK